jgi:hypothetical protein
LVWHFSKISTIFYAFYNFCKKDVLLKMYLCDEAPGKIQDRAIGSLDPRDGGLATNPVVLPAGEQLGVKCMLT